MFKELLLALLLLFGSSVGVFSTVLLSDNFDTQPDWDMSQDPSLLTGGWTGRSGENRGGNYEVGYINAAGAHGGSGKGFIQYWDAHRLIPVTITSSGTTATVTHALHGLSTGHKVDIAGCNESDYNGDDWEITVTDANTYTYTMAGYPDSPATGSPTSTMTWESAQECWIYDDDTTLPDEFWLGFWHCFDPGWNWGSVSSLKLVKQRVYDGDSLDVAWVTWNGYMDTVYGACDDTDYQYSSSFCDSPAYSFTTSNLGRSMQSCWTNERYGWHYYIWHFEYSTETVDLYLDGVAVEQYDCDFPGGWPVGGWMTNWGLDIGGNITDGCPGCVNEQWTKYDDIIVATTRAEVENFLCVNIVDAQLTCTPSLGTLPFTSSMCVQLTNNSNHYRTFSSRIDLTTAGGSSFSNWRSGYTNMSPQEVYLNCWNQNFPVLGSLVGNNTFELFGFDTTAAPYNQPPYCPEGDSDSDTCIVSGYEP